MPGLAFLQLVPIEHHSSRSYCVVSCPPRRPRRLIPRALRVSRGKRNIPLRPAACHESVANEENDLFPGTSVSEGLFSGYTHPIPKGTAEIAKQRGIPLREVSTAYGHVLASSVMEDIPITLNRDLLVSSLKGALDYADTSQTPTDLMRLSRLVSRAADPTDQLHATEVDALSTLYGSMLATSVRLSALELDAPALADGVHTRLTDSASPFPMTREAYDDAFSDLQSCAASVQGTAAVDAADSFFKSLASDSRIDDLQQDGYVLAVQTDAPVTHSPRVSSNDAVSLAARVRLLDGRCVLSALPVRDGSLESLKDALKVSLSQMPHAFTAAVMGLSVGDSRTVFYHPYAAHEVLPLFLTPEQTPPQAGLVIDLCVLHIH